jgi:hypothetical protein
VKARDHVLTALCLAGTALPAAPAAAQQSADASANAQIVSTALNITPSNPLAFGRIKSTSSGTVTVSVAPQRIATGGVVLIGSGQCSTPPCDTTNTSNPNSASFWSPAIFTISGLPNTNYRVSVPPTATALLKSGSSAPNTLQVTDINAATGSSGWTSDIGVLDGAGQATIRVGGTLQVTINLNASSYYLYTVDVPITVVFN